jgi:hypothetical protein
MNEIDIPSVPIDSGSSSNVNVHRLVQVSPMKLVLAPGNGPLVWMGIFLFIGSTAFAVLRHRHFSFEVLLAFACGPLFATIGLGVLGFIYKRFGTRAIFDKSDNEVRITGSRHGSGHRIPFHQICGLQFLDAGTKGDEGSWQAYQLNLVIQNGGIERINLLDNAAEETLRNFAQQIAAFLEVPLFTPAARTV